MEFQFERLVVYQKAIALAKVIFSQTTRWPMDMKISIGSQLNRAVLSIALNIAEGSSRTGKDFRHFLSIARGSCFECIPIIQIAYDQQLFTEKQNTELRAMLLEISRMLSSLRTKIAR